MVERGSGSGSLPAAASTLLYGGLVAGGGVLAGGGLLAGRAVVRKFRKKPKREISSAEEDSIVGDANFTCERVCASDRLIRKMGTYVRDPLPNTCITVCSTSP